MSWYDVLGVPRSASHDEIRRAYLDLARRHHPDTVAGDGKDTVAGDGEPDTVAGDGKDTAASDTMRDLTQAWAVLGNPERRRHYDAALRQEALHSRPTGGPDPDFVPYDDDHTDYAALLDDTPVDGTRVPRWLQILPVALIALALASLAVGMAASIRPLVAVGVASLVAGGLAFLGAPAFAVMSSYHAERD